MSGVGWLAWVTVAAVAIGYAVGARLAGQLAELGYRIDTEEGAPPPRALWSVAPAVGATWGLLVWHLGERHGGVDLPAYLVLATIGVALARIDADVHRLPSGLTYPTAAAVAALLVVSSALSGQWSCLLHAGVATVLATVVYLLLALVSRGQFGWGDVILGVILSGALGYLSPIAPWLALVLAFTGASLVALAGMLTRRLTLRSRIAFGPYLLAGALVAALVTG
ncbi:MAG TPA: A24 family peptidase [Dermatophilaceae bacterium]|jgi:leader peptidase (prepilin peptidase)/N-methyltransferase|nr:A24 family peptidase [Dermatophilaceae bacterium]